MKPFPEKDLACTLNDLILLFQNGLGFFCRAGNGILGQDLLSLFKLEGGYSWQGQWRFLEYLPAAGRHGALLSFRSVHSAFDHRPETDRVFGLSRREAATTIHRNDLR